MTFSFRATDTVEGEIVYRIRSRRAGGVFSTMRDYSPSAEWKWTPTDAEGLYEIEVTALNRGTGQSLATPVSYTVLPLARAAPVVSATAHPLVALYSAPPCRSGQTMRVRFRRLPETAWQATGPKQCNGTTTMNFLVAGMRASSSYEMVHDLFSPTAVTQGAPLVFATAPAGVAAPAVTIRKPLVPPTGTESITFMTRLGVSPQTLAIDSQGNMVWYNPLPSVYATRIVPGGTFLQIYGFTTDLANSGFQEVDMTGNILKETNVQRLNDQLALRNVNPITGIHHEVRKLDNGSYLVLAMSERILTVQNGTPTDIVGDTILVLDADLQVQWAWDSFNHLDVTRVALGNQTCTNGTGLCVLLKADIANDWTHGNALALTPDGQIVLSARHQDFVYKIRYAYGIGDGRVIWKLGKDGDFTWLTPDPYPWFSHQHDALFDAPNILSVFDNGNLRVAKNGGNSRSQVLYLDETKRTVTPLLNADLGKYSFALGSSQRLANGNYFAANGSVSPGLAEVTEVDADGRIVSLMEVGGWVYRAFRVPGLSSYRADQNPQCASPVLSSNSVEVPATGQASDVRLLATQGCAWSASSPESWTQIYPLQGTGATTASYTVFPNFGSTTRTALLNIGGQPFSVRQPGNSAIPDERFIQLLYFSFFGRLPTPAEVLFQLTSALRSGGSRQDLAASFFTSPEFSLGGRFVAGAYVGVLDRDPDYGGWLFQRNAVALSGIQASALVENFLESAEYLQRFGSPSKELYVRLLYRYILQREATPDEVAYHAATLTDNSAESRTPLATAFLNSAEFQANSGARLSAFLLYATLLQRDPSAEEKNALIRSLSEGTSLNAAIGALLTTPEFVSMIN